MPQLANWAIPFIQGALLPKLRPADLVTYANFAIMLHLHTDASHPNGGPHCLPQSRSAAALNDDV
jgi:hypothetical protein